ncbi:hypothetical protein [Deinococcus sp. Leaf326]|uniref:hypothetical protein n=1 Tax=Deinococcus sp. Leaf326 TaxID=1736338 RepID=UPI0007018D91|nr:hypothetical protein [Deinococcus sp. Leaf326]KQR21873.1 hypothetical protein ASF71_19400 [Deinococcus sp. Leaf326]
MTTPTKTRKTDPNHSRYVNALKEQNFTVVTTKVNKDGERVVEGTHLSMMLESRLDPFQAAQYEVRKDLVFLTDKQAIELSKVLNDPETDKRTRNEVFELLFRTTAPEALKLAVQEAEKFHNFDAAWATGRRALWKALERWDPTRGMRLLTFVRAVLPPEFERDYKEQDIHDQEDRVGTSVSSSIATILDGGQNRPWTTHYSDTQGQLLTIQPREINEWGMVTQEAMVVLQFPEHTTVSWEMTKKGNRIVSVLPQTRSHVQNVVKTVRGRQISELKEVQLPISNPMQEWMTQSKTDQSGAKFFNPKTRNWPRKQDRSKTGYKVSELALTQQAFDETVLGTKFTSRLMQRLVFLKPFKPIRDEDITPRMVQMAIRRHRTLSQQVFDARTWSLPKIGQIMEGLKMITSYDEVISDDAGDTTRKSDFLAAPDVDMPDEFAQAVELVDAYVTVHGLDRTQPLATLLGRDLTPALVNAIAVLAKGRPRIVIDDAIVDQAEYAPEQFADAARISEKLMKSGLWEIATSIPLHKFLLAHRTKAAGAEFCALCSNYGVRVKFALQIVELVEAGLR